MEKELRLSPRLKKIAAFVPPAARLWDVGCDHAKLPVYLLQQKRINFAVASDIHAGPLESAKKTAEKYFLSNRMSFILCDGLPSENIYGADCVVIAGMGGETIRDILSSAVWTCAPGVTLLLQPMTAAAELRRFLFDSNYNILGEHYVSESHAKSKKHYLIIRAAGGGAREDYTETELRIGKPQHQSDDPSGYIAAELLRLEKEIAGAEIAGDAAQLKTLTEIKKGAQDRL